MDNGPKPLVAFVVEASPSASTEDVIVCWFVERSQREAHFLLDCVLAALHDEIGLCRLVSCEYELCVFLYVLAYVSVEVCGRDPIVRLDQFPVVRFLV